MIHCRHILTASKTIKIEVIDNAELQTYKYVHTCIHHTDIHTHTEEESYYCWERQRFNFPLEALEGISRADMFSSQMNVIETKRDSEFAEVSAWIV